MIDSRAELSRRSEEDAGCRPSCRPRDDGTVRCRFRVRYDPSSSGMSLSSICDAASSTSGSERVDEERRLHPSSTRVLSSGTASASKVGSPSVLVLNSVLVLVLLLLLLVLVVGEGKG